MHDLSRRRKDQKIRLTWETNKRSEEVQYSTASSSSKRADEPCRILERNTVLYCNTSPYGTGVQYCTVLGSAGDRGGGIICASPTLLLFELQDACKGITQTLPLSITVAHAKGCFEKLESASWRHASCLIVPVTLNLNSRQDDETSTGKQKQARKHLGRNWEGMHCNQTKLQSLC